MYTPTGTSLGALAILAINVMISPNQPGLATMSRRSATKCRISKCSSRRTPDDGNCFHKNFKHAEVQTSKTQQPGPAI